ncbi:hypothetical protein ACOJBO_01655 [Rhizobium beringeri]
MVFGCKLAEHVRPSRTKCSPDDSRIICDGIQGRDHSDDSSYIGFGSHSSHHSVKPSAIRRSRARPSVPQKRRSFPQAAFLARRLARPTSDWNIDNVASVKVVANSLKVAIMTACRRGAFICWNACAV